MKQCTTVCFSTSFINGRPFHDLMRARFSPFFLGVLEAILLFKVFPKHSANALSSISTCKNIIVRLTEKTCVTDKPLSRYELLRP